MILLIDLLEHLMWSSFVLQFVLYDGLTRTGTTSCDRLYPSFEVGLFPDLLAQQDYIAAEWMRGSVSGE
jgi:hypothetical protein